MLITLEKAIEKIRSGEVVAIPTETVYGLAASFDNENAIQKIFKLKNRPQDNPLIVHISSVDQLSFVDSFPPQFHQLIETFWPGPLTLILPVKKGFIPSIVTGGLSTVGVRMPNHIQALSCIEKTGPVVAPSANISGRPSATQPSHIEEDFGENFPILYGGSCQQGVESTILYPTESGWKIVRLGVISPENLKKVLGYSVLASQEQQLLWKKNKVPVAPGQKYRHYAPETKLILGIQYNGEPNVLGFAERNYPEAKQIIVLGSLSHPEEIAARLYDQLRQLDQLGIKEIWVDCDFPQEGILRTIHERLERASHKE